MLQPQLCPLLVFILLSSSSPLLPADGQTARGGGDAGGGGGGVERIQVTFTPTICKVRCSQGRCTNFCQRGNVTTLYSGLMEGGGGRRDGSHVPGFRVFVCPLICKNGGVCLQKDRCLCPPTFTGKFCHIPVAAPASTNEVVQPALLSAGANNQELTRSEFLLPLQQIQEAAAPAPAPSMVKVHVQHPPEASVNIHQVLKVSSSSSSGWAGAPAPAAAPAAGGVQAQTVRGGGTFTQQSGFKYCFREVRDGQCSSPLPGLRSKEMCCKGIGKAWGITDCVLCPDNTGQNRSNCPAGFELANGTQCVDVNECLDPRRCENGLCVNTRGSYSCVCQAGFILDATHGLCISQSVISEEKGQCHRVLGSGLGVSSCSLPILKNITKQICCCSRVGKAWGPDCQRCPYFGSVAFKETCPAGPGYHYSASALQFNQRVSEHLGDRGAQLLPNNPDNQGSDPGPSSSGASSSQQKPSSSGAGSSSAVTAHGTRYSQPQPPPSVLQPQPQPPPNQPQPRPPPNQPQPQPRPPPNQPQPQPRPPPSQPQPRTPPNQPQPQPPPNQPQPRPPPNQPQPQPQPPPKEPQPRPPPSQPQPRPLPNQPQPQPQPRPSPNQPQPRTPANQPQHQPQPRPPPSQPQPPPSQPQPPPSQPQPPPSQPQPLPGLQTQPQLQSPSIGSQDSRSTSSLPHQPSVRGDNLHPPTQPRSPEDGSRPQGRLPPLNTRLTVKPTTTTTTRQSQRVQAVHGVCGSRPGVCGRGQCVDQPSGKHTCVCDQGFKLNSQRTHCEDIDECVQSPCRDARCENTLGSFRCVCRLGFRLSGNTCTDVDECVDPLQCPGQECVNSQGSYHCVSCRPGFKLLNRICTDVDECVEAPCSDSHCENTPGSYRCVCHHGYKLQNNTCTDIDECAELSQCPGQVCVNSVGSYRCVSCRPGYTLTSRQCTDVNECENSESCPGQQCVNTEGSYSCVDCNHGYNSVNGVCTDVDECEQVSQCPGQECVNTVGSYRCVSCRPGFRSINGVCEDEDECVRVGACEAGRVCVNSIGSFRCDCQPGYQTFGLSRQCRDINECLEGDFCFSRGECVNTPGSYMCVCSQGFTLSDNRTACLDLDECVRPGVCLDGRCVNTEGSYRCECETGFTPNPERTACLDLDECVSSGGSVCGSQRCENTIGSYRCLTSCDPGYQVTEEGRCADVDECVSVPPVCGSARCENVVGSFMCVCDRAGDEFDPTAAACVRTVPLSERLRDRYTSSSSSSSSSSSPPHVLDLSPVLPALPAARPGELRECYYNLADRGTCSLLATNSTQQECCCTVGEAWGLGCLYHPCPPAHTAQFLSLCPSGRGYVTTGPGAFSYTDVDECKRFQPEVCKNGVCVNNIPGYSCYCSSGYVYNSTLLECVDHDECEEESCVGGVCVNTVGSYYCSCPPPLVLDDTQRNCVNSTFLTVDENLSVCWQHVTADLLCQSALLGAQVTFTDCCCLYGEGWGMGCALCPPTDSEDYARLCSSFPPPPLFPGSYPDSTEPDPRRRGGAPLLPPYGLDFFAPPVVPGRDFGRPDYDDYAPAGGVRSGFRGRAPAAVGLPDESYRSPEYSSYFSEGDFRSPDVSPPRTPSFRPPPDPRVDSGFRAPPLSLAPYQEQEEEQEEEEEDTRRRPGPPFPPYGDRSRAGGAPRRVYERRYESYAGLSAAEDCGILHGCENGRCIRVAEGYTCDCYHGYELDMTTMTCADVNECEDVLTVDFPCVNARCVNTDGSFRCVCRRGYVMSRRHNHCVAA